MIREGLETNLIDVALNLRKCLEYAKGTLVLKDIRYLNGAELLECTLVDHALGKTFTLEVRENEHS